MKEYFYKRIEDSKNIEELNNVKNPHKGDVSYVKESGFDYRFNGKKWVKVRLISHTLACWTLTATSLLICAAIAAPLAVVSIKNPIIKSSEETPAANPTPEPSTETDLAEKECMIGFISVGGPAINPIVQNSGTTVTAPNTTIEGYTFDGWYTDEGLTNAYTFSTMPNTNQYTVTFNLNNSLADVDDTPAQQNITYPGLVSSPRKPENLYYSDPNGYSFHYWEDGDGNPWDFTKPVTKNMTLYAHWEDDLR